MTGVECRKALDWLESGIGCASTTVEYTMPVRAAGEFTVAERKKASAWLEPEMWLGERNLA